MPLYGRLGLKVGQYWLRLSKSSRLICIRLVQSFARIGLEADAKQILIPHHNIVGPAHGLAVGVVSGKFPNATETSKLIGGNHRTHHSTPINLSDSPTV